MNGIIQFKLIKLYVVIYFALLEKIELINGYYLYLLKLLQLDFS